MPALGERWLAIDFTLAAATTWAERGHTVAWTQLPFVNLPASSVAPAQLPSTPLRAVETVTTLTLNGDEFALVFDKVRGRIVSWTQRGLPLLELGPRLNFWRAPIDNDRGWSGCERSWREAGIDLLQHRVDGVEVNITDEAAEIVVQVRIAPPKFTRAIKAEYRYRFDGDGTLDLDVSGDFHGQWPATVPRIGLQLFLPSRLDGVRWFGLGPGESYVDSRQAARVGLWSATLDDLYTPYVFPQENGNRHETRWLELAALDGQGLRVDGQPLIDFSAHRYTPEEFTKAKHTTDLIPRSDIVLNLDYRQHGLGSNSCGPVPLPQTCAGTRPISVCRPAKSLQRHEPLNS